QRAETGATKAKVAQTKTRTTKQPMQKITVPIMGEGIRNAKVVGLLKNPGDRIELDDPLCELETDKAVYPIESSVAGTMGEWKTEVGATVEIGQELGTIMAEGDSFAEQFETAAEASSQRPNGAAEPVATRLPLQKKSANIEPALSTTIACGKQWSHTRTSTIGRTSCSVTIRQWRKLAVAAWMR